MPTAAARIYSGLRLDPVIRPDLAVPVMGTLPVSVTYPQGQVLGELTATPGAYIALDETLVGAGLAPTGTGGSGGALDASSSFFLGYTFTGAGGGESALSAVATVTTASAQGTITTGTVTLPTGATGVNWYFSNAVGSDDLQYVGATNGAALAIAAYPLPGAKQPPRTGNAYKYTDGRAIAVALLQYPCATDSAGAITFGGGTGNEWGATELAAPVYVKGIFACADLTGLSATSIINPVGRLRLLEGNRTTGMVTLG